MLVIPSPFCIQFGLKNVECLERIEKSRPQICIACEGCLELRSQDGRLGNAINVGHKVGVVWWWIDRLDRFVGPPGFSNPAVSFGYKQNTADTRQNRKQR